MGRKFMTDITSIRMINYISAGSRKTSKNGRCAANTNLPPDEHAYWFCIAEYVSLFLA